MRTQGLHSDLSFAPPKGDLGERSVEHFEPFDARFEQLRGSDRQVDGASVSCRQGEAMMELELAPR